MKTKDFTDNSKLIKQLKKGQEKAYVFLLDKYHQRLYAYALTLVNDHALAQDITQNVFFKTWKFRKKLNPKFSIQNFLYKSVYNEFINTYKKDQAVKILEMKYYESLSEIVENTDDKAIQKMVELVFKEIEKLPPRCRQIFSLSKKEGLTNIEISEHLGIAKNTVEVQMSKAFNIIRKKLEHKYDTILFMIFGVSYDNLKS